MTLADLIKPLVWFEVEKSRHGGKYKSDGYTITICACEVGRAKAVKLAAMATKIPEDE